MNALAIWEYVDNFAIIYQQSGSPIMKNDGKEFDGMHGLNTYDYGARQ